MFRKKITGLLLMVLFSLPAFAQNKDAILGKWFTASGDGQIMIYKSGDKYSGKLIWLKEPDDEKGQLKRDSKNPLTALRNRPLLGKIGRAHV